MAQKSMQAVQIRDYGGPEVLELVEVPIPQPGAGQLLVQLKAAGVNPADWKMRGGAYRQFMPLNMPWTPGLEVDTWWDLGVDDSMSIWFVQVAGKEFRFIDYYENSGYGLEHYAKVLKEKPYVYGNHYMPHDADVREMSSGEIARSRREVAEGLGLRPIVVVPRVRNIDTLIQVHIPAVRNLLSQSWLDEKKCATGISGLEGYQAEYDEEKKVLSNRPAHTWCSHAADAFRTGAVGYRPEELTQPVEEFLGSIDLSGRW